MLGLIDKPFGLGRVRCIRLMRPLLMFVLGLGLAFGMTVSVTASAVLQPVSYPPSDQQNLAVPLGYDPQIFGHDSFSADRPALVGAIDHSLGYLNTPVAGQAYRDYPVASITRDRVRRSLIRFRELLRETDDAEALRVAVAEDFEFYRTIGNDDQGTVAFTGYFEPTYGASRVRTDTYRYPLYRVPPTLDRWASPHPTRIELEGADGLQANQGPLRGLELVWLRDRLEAFLVQVQGSARLQLTDGSVMSVGYAGRTDYAYTSIGRQLIDDGKIREEDLSLPVLLDYFRAHPDALNVYLPRNQRFVFFRATNGAPPTGSLGVPVTAGRSIATDKTVMPPGALALISLSMPMQDCSGTWGSESVNRYVLDQDTGGAIRGPGRVDLFVGTGIEAGEQAGLINTNGTLYYLLLKDEG
ncbi:MAG: MltA domain-containing protein [Cyanobacteria bacterium J06635_15]